MQDKFVQKQNIFLSAPQWAERLKKIHFGNDKKLCNKKYPVSFLTSQLIFLNLKKFRENAQGGFWPLEGLLLDFFYRGNFFYDIDLDHI